MRSFAPLVLRPHSTSGCSRVAGRRNKFTAYRRAMAGRKKNCRVQLRHLDGRRDGTAPAANGANPCRLFRIAALIPVRETGKRENQRAENRPGNAGRNSRHDAGEESFGCGGTKAVAIFSTLNPKDSTSRNHKRQRGSKWPRLRTWRPRARRRANPRQGSAVRSPGAASICAASWAGPILRIVAGAREFAAAPKVRMRFRARLRKFVGLRADVWELSPPHEFGIWCSSQYAIVRAWF